MNVKQFESKLKIENLMKEVETIENSLHLVFDEKTKELREHKAKFYYGVLNGVIKQLKKEYKVLDQFWSIKDKIRLKNLQKQLFENCSQSFQQEINADKEIYVSI